MVYSDQSSRRPDAIIVGAGIAGLSIAYLLVRAGKSVMVLDRSHRAVGASIRNFGMIWVVGQPIGEIRGLAERSRAHWTALLEEANIWHRECGSMHLAYAEDELQVMQEFVDRANLSEREASIISAEEAVRRSPHIRRESLLGALVSETELAVDPRITVDHIAKHLESRYGVQFRFGATVHKIASGSVTLEGGTLEADRIFVCAGPDLQELLGEHVEPVGLRRCRLQMMRLQPKRPDYRLGMHLCAGLTLTHYANFADCPSLPKLRERLDRDWPEQSRLGIHLLVSQQGDGMLTVGDSHEYGDTFLPYRSERVDEAILSYLDTFLSRSDFEVIERWDGFYNSHRTLPYYVDETIPGITIVNLFGTGMTLSFGVAEQVARI